MPEHHLNKRVTKLEEKVSLLERPHTPRQNRPESPCPHQNPDQWNESTIGQATLSNNSSRDGTNAPDNGQHDKDPSWIRMWSWKPWKRGLTVLVWLTGIGYAIITYYLWLDSNRNFKIDQRAWLGYQEVTDVSLTSADASSKMVIWFINTGKTPALKFKGHANTKLVYPSQTFAQEYKNPTPEPSLGYVMPGQRAHLEIGSTGPWEPLAIKALKEDRVKLHVFSEICYKDIFGVSHHSTFCGHVVAPALNTVATCGAYNEPDDKPTEFCKEEPTNRP
jgi:hypothetical protein